MTQQVLAQGTTLKGKKYTYTIHKVLGQGSFGITYLATTQVDVDGELGHLKTSIQVAIKEFFMRDINGREGSVVTTGSQGGLYDNYRRKFINEARNISRLEHPHVVRVLEAFETNNTAYYAMEFCVGGSLDAKVNAEGGLSERVALGYFEQIASALQYMHDHKMLHLDLKPSNVMLRHDNDVAIIDFGLSKQYDADGNPESSTTIGGGTPGYAPLEQTNYREGSEFPVTMDVYALGATLYKMLAGVRPPEAADLLNQGFPADALRARQVSEATIVAIEKAMSPIKAQRYPTVARLAMALGYDISAAGTPQHKQATPTEADEKTVIDEDKTAPIAHHNVVAEKPQPVAPAPAAKPTQPDKDKTIYDATAQQVAKPAPKPAPVVEEMEKKSSKKWLWILLAVLVALIVGGAGYYQYNQNQERIALERIEAEQAEEARIEAEQTVEVCIEAEPTVEVCIEAEQTEEVCIEAEKKAVQERKAQEAARQAALEAAQTYKVGDYYNRDGVKGVVFAVWDGGRHGKIVSMDESSNYLQWCTYEQDDKEIAVGASSETNGKANTDKIAQYGLSNYPAAQWCRKKGSNWYLPAKNELLAIYNNKSVINATLKEYGGDELSFYWSSTEYTEDDEFCAWGVYMSVGGTSNYFKVSYIVVRAVSAF